jgi:hypothetical protein
MIAVSFEKHGNCPVLICRWCRERVYADNGNYVYHTKPGLTDAGDQQISEIHFVHKGECDRRSQKVLGRTNSGEIPALLGFLVHNTRTTHERAKEAADQSESFRL